MATALADFRGVWALGASISQLSRNLAAFSIPARKGFSISISHYLALSHLSRRIFVYPRLCEIAPPNIWRTKKMTDRKHTCGNCRYWHHVDRDEGQCRYRPPIFTTFPPTTDTDWCGSHERGPKRKKVEPDEADSDAPPE